MKKLLFILLMALGLNASEVAWSSSYIAASQTAKDENRPMLVFMNKPGCGSCAYMKENVFTDAAVIAYLNDNYVAISLDIHKNDAPADLQVNVTPVFHFLKPDGSKSQESLIGGKTAPFFLKLLKKANTPAE